MQAAYASRFAAVVNTLYVLAGVALFATGTAPVITPTTNFLGDKFAMAWAGWKFSGCLYMALVNWGVELGPAAAAAMVPYIAFDVFALLDTAHWNPAACFGFIALEAVTAIAALCGYLQVGGVINGLYVLAGVALFATGEAPVLAPGAVFLGDSFSMAWAGWKFAGCGYFAMINLGTHSGLAMAVSMVPYVAFDVFAVRDTAHWTVLAAGFVVLDGAMALLGLKAFFESKKMKEM